MCFRVILPELLVILFISKNIVSITYVWLREDDIASHMDGVFVNLFRVRAK